MSREEKKCHTIKTDATVGEVKIADEVVAVIAGLAAMEVEKELLLWQVKPQES